MATFETSIHRSVLVACFFMATLSLCSCSAIPGFGPAARPVNHATLVKGQALLQAGENTEAEAFYKAQLVSNEKSADSHYGLGCVYAVNGEDEKAIAQFSRCVELDPGMDKAFTNRGNMYLAQEEFDKAISDYSRAIKLRPAGYAHWYGRSMANFNSQNYKAARIDATESINRFPKLGSAYLLRAKAEKKLGLNREAEEDLQSSFNCPVLNTTDARWLGSYLWDEGRVEEALVQFRRMVKANPRFCAGYAERGRCEMTLGMLPEARADIEMANRLAASKEWFAEWTSNLKDLEYDSAHKVNSLPLRWGLACSALMFTHHSDGCLSIAGDRPTAQNIEGEMKSLSQSWGIESKEDLMAVLKALTSKKQRLHPAWDYCRYIALVRWGYKVGYLKEKEVAPLILPVARQIQKSYKSWRAMGEDYLLGRQAWNLNQWKADEEEYKRITTLLLTQKNSPWIVNAWDTRL